MTIQSNQKNNGPSLYEGLAILGTKYECLISCKEDININSMQSSSIGRPSKTIIVGKDYYLSIDVVFNTTPNTLILKNDFFTELEWLMEEFDYKVMSQHISYSNDVASSLTISAIKYFDAKINVF